MLSLRGIIQITLVLVPLYTIITTAAATQSESSLIATTPTSSASDSQITTSSSVLRPTEGEIVVYGSPYTIKWSPPTITGGISIELWDADSGSWASSFSLRGQNGIQVSCDGWLSNSQCGKIAQSVPNNGSYVWNVSSTVYELLGENSTYYLGIYIQQSDDHDLPSNSSLWYVKSGVFTLAATASSYSSSSGATVTSSTTRNSSFSTSTGVGQTATSSTGGVGRITTDQFEWMFIGIMGVLAI